MNTNRNKTLLAALVAAVAFSSVFCFVAFHVADTEAAAAGDYTVDGGGLTDAPFTDLSLAIAAIESDAAVGATYTITVHADDPTAPAVTINAGKHVIITSADPANPCTLTSTTTDIRQIIVTGTGTMLTVEDIIFNGNTSGGGIGVESAGQLNVNYGTKIYYCHGINGGGIQVNGNNSKFYMTGGEICSNKARDYGGGIYSANNTGLICEITGGLIDNNVQTSTGYGGGICCMGNATISNCVVSNNTTGSNGSGIYFCGGTITDTIVSDNGTTVGNTSGGGIFVSGSSAVTSITGCTITGNKAFSGGGIRTATGTITTIKDDIISYNEVYVAGGGSGGGIYASSTVNINGQTEICNNTAGQGGGISASDSGTSICTISENVKISHNTAIYGGGYYSSSSSSAQLTISGNVLISDNTATGNSKSTMGSGGGIRVAKYSSLMISDGVVFSGNKATAIRVQDISSTLDNDKNGTPDLTDYSHTIGAVILDNFVDNGQNATAYNNYDINYASDSYVVSFDTNGGTTIDHQFISADGMSLALVPEDPTSNGYDFTGWFADNMLTTEFDFAVPITASTTIYAGWEETGDGNGGDGGNGGGDGNGGDGGNGGGGCGESCGDASISVFGHDIPVWIVVIVAVLLLILIAAAVAKGMRKW